MVKRGGGDVVTVDIYRELYSFIQKLTEPKGIPIKAYINYLLVCNMNKFEYTQQTFPYLSIDSYHKDRIRIKDSENKKLVDVFQSHGELFCEEHKELDCPHIRFIWINPEIGAISNVSVPPKTSGRFRQMGLGNLEILEELKKAPINPKEAKKVSVIAKKNITEYS